MFKRKGLTLPGGLAALALLAAAAAWVLQAGRVEQPELAGSSRLAGRTATGSPQLVAAEPLPPMDGEMCQWIPASAEGNLLAMLQQGGGPSAAATVPRTATEPIDRPP